MPTRMMPREWDRFAYDDIVALVRREGRLDALGCDLIPAVFNNHIPWHDGPDTRVRPWDGVGPGYQNEMAARLARSRAPTAAARAQAAWESERAERLAAQEEEAAGAWAREAVRRGEGGPTTWPAFAIDELGNEFFGEILEGRRSPFDPRFRVLIIEKRRRHYLGQGAAPAEALQEATAHAFREARHFWRQTRAAWYLRRREMRRA